MSQPNGITYRALRRLSTGDDVTLADVGEGCDRVPADSLAWLLEQGHIEPVPAAALPVLADEKGAVD